MKATKTKKPTRAKKTLKVPVTLRLTPETTRKLRILAERLGVTRTAVIEMALREKFSQAGV